MHRPDSHIFADRVRVIRCRRATACINQTYPADMLLRRAIAIFQSAHAERGFVMDHHPIRAVIVKADECAALSQKVRASAPILSLCRKLIASGYDPALPLHAYRGDTLALKVRSIGEGAQYTVGDNKLGTPIFPRWQSDAQRDMWKGAA
jgi:hypothetical protein